MEVKTRFIMLVFSMSRGMTRMAEQTKSKGAEWIESVVEEHIHKPDTYSWSGLPDEAMLLIKKLNVRITFPKALSEGCAEANSVCTASLKKQLVELMHLIKDPKYKNETFHFNEAPLSGWTFSPRQSDKIQ